MVRKIVGGVGAGVIASAAAAGAIGVITMQAKKNQHPNQWARDHPDARMGDNSNNPFARMADNVKNMFGAKAPAPAAPVASARVADSTAHWANISAPAPVVETTPAPVGTTQPMLADAVDPAKYKKGLLLLGVALVVCCVCMVGFLGAMYCCFHKKRKTRGGFDKVDASERMYDLEEPTGPTDSQINASPYKMEETDNSSMYMDGSMAAATLPPLAPVPVTMPPLRPIYNPPVYSLQSPMPMVGVQRVIA